MSPTMKILNTVKAIQAMPAMAATRLKAPRCSCSGSVLVVAVLMVAVLMTRCSLFDVRWMSRSCAATAVAASVLVR